ncbi:MAG: glycosyltransferase family 87 protein [Pseudomonadota bacterium]|nr:glycosyltransferase family 87 protein [Pseudomonadota bacterium]
MRPPDRRHALLGWLLAAIVGAAAAREGATVWATASAYAPSQAIDALPIYLSGAVVRAHGDPTDRAALERAHTERGMHLAPAVFSNLYPASTGVMFGSLTDRPWPDFVPIWRGLLLGGAIVAGLAGGLAGVRGPAAPLGAAVGAWLVLASFPVTAECIGIGQVNLLVAGILALCMAAASRGWSHVAGALAVVGAGIKLVPALVLWPLVAARRWSGVALAVAVTVALVAWTTVHVPLPTFLAGIAATLASKASISADWVARRSTGALCATLGEFRHLPLGILTVVYAGVCAALAPREPRVLAAGMALGVAWLGADAAGFLTLYATLYLPALVYLATWPLDRDAPRWAWGAAPIGLLPALVVAAESYLVPEARLALVGEVVWLGVAVRLWWHARPARRPLAGLFLATLVVVGAFAWWKLRPLPPLPRGQPPHSYTAPMEAP